MELVDNKTSDELIKSLLAEVAKAGNELKCARADLDKASGRIGFSLVLINTLLDRNTLQGD